MSAALLALLSATASVFAGEPCPDRQRQSAELRAFARQMDYLGDRYLRSPQERDVRTAAGTLLDPSCSRRIPVEKLEKVVGRAMFLADRCRRLFHLPGLSDVPSVLRRASVSCSDGDFIATNLTIREEEDHPEAVVHRGADRRYQFVLGQRASQFLAKDDFESILIHEALHSTASNSTGWHNEASKRGDRTCENSMFEDRVYLMDAACVPHGAHSSFWERGVVACPGLCERALTQVNAVLSIDEEIGNRASRGPTPRAKPLTREEATLTCDRLRRFYHLRVRLEDERAQLQKRKELLGARLKDPMLAALFADIETYYRRGAPSLEFLQKALSRAEHGVTHPAIASALREARSVIGSHQRDAEVAEALAFFAR